MKCEICHKADAATVLHRKKKDGSDEELYVCKACAAHPDGPTPKPDHGKSKPETAKVSFSDGEPPPFVENFVKAALGLVEGIAEQEKEKKACPGCGHTWERIKEEKRVGCPRCYRTFAELIRTEFLTAAYGRTHVGAMPKGVTGKDSRTYLERELKDAVRRQQFEKAATIRRKLNALDGNDAPHDHHGSPEQK